MDEEKAETTAGALLGVANEGTLGGRLEPTEIPHPKGRCVVGPAKTPEAPASGAAAQVNDASGNALAEEERKDSVSQASCCYSRLARGPAGEFHRAGESEQHECPRPGRLGRRR